MPSPGAAPSDVRRRRRTPRIVAGFAGVALLVGLPLTACDPAPLGAGCHFPVNATSVRLNQNTASGGDGNLNIAALDGGSAWNSTGSKAPRINSYWPATSGSPYGLGEFEVRSYTNNQSANSGYTSTVGPSGGFAAPSCGSSAWGTKPHIWLNATKINQREAMGQWNWNISTASHELGHALGLDHNANSACADVTIMESTSQHTYVDCGVYKPRAGDIRSVNAIYN